MGRANATILRYTLVDSFAGRRRLALVPASWSIYYLGPTFDGWDLDEAGIYEDGYDNADRTLDPGYDGTLFYGSTCSRWEQGTCGWHLEVTFHRITPAEKVVGCLRRLPATRGAFAIRTTYGDAIVFTDQEAVTVHEDSFDALGGRVIQALRPVGQPAASSDLPPPPQFVIDAITKACPKA